MKKYDSNLKESFSFSIKERSSGFHGVGIVYDIFYKGKEIFSEASKVDLISLMKEIKKYI